MGRRGGGWQDRTGWCLRLPCDPARVTRSAGVAPVSHPLLIARAKAGRPWPQLQRLHHPEVELCRKVTCGRTAAVYQHYPKQASWGRPHRESLPPFRRSDKSAPASQRLQSVSDPRVAAPGPTRRIARPGRLGQPWFKLISQQLSTPTRIGFAASDSRLGRLGQPRAAQGLQQRRLPGGSVPHSPAQSPADGGPRRKAGSRLLLSWRRPSKQWPPLVRAAMRGAGRAAAGRAAA